MMSPPGRSLRFGRRADEDREGMKEFFGAAFAGRSKGG
jgi:hypothetical protein